MHGKARKKGTVTLVYVCLRPTVETLEVLELLEGKGGLLPMLDDIMSVPKAPSLHRGIVSNEISARIQIELPERHAWKPKSCASRGIANGLGGNGRSWSGFAGLVDALWE